LRNAARRPRVLVLDNQDSFTFNLVQAVQAQGAEARVERCDKAGRGALRRHRPTHVLVSPGPGHPRDAGLSLWAIRHWAGKVPLLGVCLGHQALAQAFGGRVGRAPRPLHGRATAVRHRGQGVFRGLPAGFPAGRYHSLAVDPRGLPSGLEVTAWDDEGTILGLRHESGAEGVQFHPESILTPCGDRLLRNFLCAR
jgi:anthranilate synthase/aminodeoxychorismate synthase-like glutamine amidotransferase